MKTNEVWVFIEENNDKIAEVSLELLGKATSLVIMGSFKIVFIGYSPMHTKTCFCSSGFNPSICFSMLASTLNVALSLFIRGTYISFKRSLPKIRF